MCSECGDLYTRAGYKIVEVPWSGASPMPPPVIVKNEHPAVTQEPAGSSRILEKETKPPWPTQVVTKQKPVPKSFTTMYTQTKPSRVNNAYTQTEPSCVSNAYTQTSSLQELSDTWKTEYELSQGKAFQQQKSTWLNYAYRNWEVLKQSRAQHKENKKLKTKLSFIFDLVQRLLATRKPSLNYSVFLRERLAFLQIKAIKDGRPH